MPDCMHALVIFSLASPLERVVKALRNVSEKNVILLSTCRLFDAERSKVSSGTDKNIVFHCFADFISEQEMMRCDEGADLIVVRDHGERRHDLLPEYYAAISTLKNTIIHDNINKRYSFSCMLILDGNLGVNRDVWITHGASDLSESCGARRRQAASRFKCKRSGTLKYNGQEYLFLGNSGRVRQFLSADVELLPHAAWVSLFLYILLHVVSRLSRSVSFLPRVMTSLACSVFRILFLGNADGMATTLHEYGVQAAEAASCLGVSLTCLQDGFLPSNYSSVYIKYFSGIDRFLVFDDMSGKFFERFNLPFVSSGMFRNPQLPFFPEKPVAVRRVLVVASGAGDWTALKNRSDEDIMFEAFVEVARRMPNILFVYRPHPLWVHPEHQGVRSIQRLHEYCKIKRLRNIVVSENAAADSVRYGREHSQSLCFPSIDEEIFQSDFVFGDHSQVMINACRKGKMFASVNFVSRMSFFDSFNAMGFHHCTTVEQVVELLTSLPESVEPAATHNAAVAIFNTSNVNMDMSS